MTVALCLEQCWMYNYAGIEYARECWCGNEIDLVGNQESTPAEVVSDSECSFACSGNSTEYCGAGVRQSLYVLRALQEPDGS
jgi:hypothetical protein